MTLAGALEAIGDVAPRLRAIHRAERDPEAAGRARVDLIERLRRIGAGEHGPAVLDLTPDGAAEWLAALGAARSGRDPLGDARQIPRTLRATDAEWAEVRRLAAEAGASSAGDWLLRVAGVRS